MFHFPYAHPLPDTVRQRVDAELSALETRYRVRVLFACESGSRAWGFASPDSDYDVRFLYVHEPEWYLRVQAQRDVIELPISDELDISGWELRKALRLLAAGNPTLFEWLQSPLLYRAEPQFVAELLALAAHCHSPLKSRWHYLSMARKNFRGYLQGDMVRWKKYLYVLRPLLAAAWLDAGRGMVPMRFADLASAMVHEPALAAAITELLQRKMQAGEAAVGPAMPQVDAFIRKALAQYDAAPPLPAPTGTDGLDALLYRQVLGITSSLA
ncbi:nucleotidyltransferase domain-containing protein [Vogesella amnigena]|uniref:Nucleotidyltransferase domain-containing protein n=1 Tax=Vogesella amnigena TaxID=1507449 RepID=A0ABV7TUZ3_9NEIS